MFETFADLAAEEFEVAIEGPVYVHCSSCEPGHSEPTGFRGEFRAYGTIAEIGRAWHAWCNKPTQSVRGHDYSQRFILGKTPLDQIIDEIIRRHGGLRARYYEEVSRLSRLFRTGSYY